MTNIFISYGHDEYANIADKLYDRLSELADEKGNSLFHVEKDNRGAIRAGHIWYSDLEKAIRKSQFIIYLMSRHSTRVDGICLEEITLAKNCKISIIPVRIENISSPFLICSLHRIDWLEIPDNFEAIFKEILEAVFDYDFNVRNSKQGVLFNQLFKAEFFCESGEIIGREDVISEIEEFVDGDLIGPLVIRGIAGSGKSAVISELSRNDKLVRSVHRCRFDFQETRTVHNTLCNLAYFLSCKNKDYEMQIGTADIDNVESWELGKLFEELFVKPLGNEKEKYAIVIDGIDEMELLEAKELLNIIRNGAKYIRNVKFIVAVRSEKSFAASCAGLPCIELTEERNRAAAEKMLSRELDKRGIFTEKLLNKMLDASEGNFLYLAKLFEDCDTNGKEISENTDFPNGLISLYENSMVRFFPDIDLYRNEYAPVLSVLCAVKRPVTAEELSALTGYSKIKLNRTLLKLRYLIKFEAERISVYHRSMQEFLISENSEEYMIDPNEGDMLIVENASRMKKRELERNEYFSSYLFCHIFSQKDVGLADRIYSKDKEWAEKCAVSSVLVLSEEEFICFADTVSDMEHGKQLTNLIFWNYYNDRKIQAAQQIAVSIENICTLKEDSMLYKGLCCLVSDSLDEAKNHIVKALDAAKIRAKNEPSYESCSMVGSCYAWLGDIAIKEDKIKEAKELYSQAFDIVQKNAESFPSYESSRDLSIGYRTLADMALSEDDVRQAKELYNLAFGIAEQNAKDAPSYESKRDLVVCYNNIAHIAAIEDNKPEAKRLYSISLDITIQLDKDFPSYQSKRDLAICYNKLAAIAEAEGNISEVKRLCSLGIKIVEQLAADFPSYQSKRDLSVGYERLGNIALKEGNLPEAERLYSLSLEIREQLARNYPSHHSKRNLSKGYKKMGDIASKNGDNAGAERFYSLCIEIAEQNVAEFPSYQSRRDLSKVYERKGRIAEAEDDIYTAERFYSLSLEIDQYNAETFPSYRTMYIFAKSCSNLAKVLKKQGKASEAMQVLNAGIEAANENYEKTHEKDSMDICCNLQNLLDRH